jgi:hypothetical protein
VFCLATSLDAAGLNSQYFDCGLYGLRRSVYNLNTVHTSMDSSVVINSVWAFHIGMNGVFKSSSSFFVLDRL